MMSLRKALVCMCVLGWMGCTAMAQAPQGNATKPTGAAVSTNGTKVHGTITDPDGALIPGAKITLTPAKGSAVTATSGSDGTYAATVAPGSYTLLVTMPGFAAYSVVNLRVPAVASTTIDAKLKIGEQTQVVNVDATTIQLSVDPENNADATILTGKDLDALSDDPDELESELTALAGPSAGPSGGQIYVDGFTGGQLPPKSSIREIRVNSNPFSAQYDKLGYGRVEVFTKPGTDKIHGNFQMNGNPSQFNSEDAAIDAGAYQPPYHTLFMFGSLTGPMGSKASYSLGGSHRDIQQDQLTHASILALPGSTAICAQGPIGTAGCGLTAFAASTYFPQVRTEFNPRFDFALGDKNVLSVRLEFEQNSATDDGPGGTNLPTYLYNSSSSDDELQMSDTQTFSPKLINETRFEYERARSGQTVPSTAPTVNVSGSFVGGGYSGQNQSDHQDHFEVQNYTSIQLKKNFVRLGGRLRTMREAENNQGGTNGEFTYTSLLTAPLVVPGSSADNSYQTGTPSQFSYTILNSHKIGDTYADLGLYAESDWKARPNMTISYGIRYETQNHLSDHHDFAPRVAISYGLGGAKGGAPKVVLHGGFGLFYDRFSQGNVLQLEAENGVNETVYTIKNPGSLCTPNALFTPLTTAMLSNCGVTASAASQQTQYSAASNLRTPYITQFAGGVDKQLGRFGKMSVNYVHSQGVHELATQNITYVPSVTTPPNYQYFTEGVFQQNQLIVNGSVQTTRWLSLFGYYTLGSAKGDTSGAGSFITTPGNIAADYGRTGFDVRNHVFLAGSVTLPKYIQFSPFVIGQSGNPYNVTTGTDVNGDSIYNDRPYLVPAGTPESQTITGCGTFLQRGVDAPAPPAGSQIVPINYCTGPALFTFNFRLTKTFGFGASKVAANGNGQGGGQGGPGGPGGPPGSHQRGGGRGGPGGGAGGGMFGGGGGSTGKRYNLGFGVQVQNLFNNADLGTPQGALTSPELGVPQRLTGGPYTSSNALRRISLQASFNF